MMKPFKKMWETIQVPIQSTSPQGYDVVMASEMLGVKSFDNDEHIDALEKLKEVDAWNVSKQAFDDILEYLKSNDISLNIDEINYGLFLGDDEKLKLQKGYTGFGGIPGYILLIIDPNEYNIPKIPAVIAHEFHHNFRFSIFEWNHGNVSVGDYIVIEGLADSFATALYGEEMMGPWITDFDQEDLEYSQEIIKQAIDIKGFSEVSSYMFGDLFLNSKVMEE